jgi:hypothetical protein
MRSLLVSNLEQNSVFSFDHVLGEALQSPTYQEIGFACCRVHVYAVILSYSISPNAAKELEYIRSWRRLTLKWAVTAFVHALPPSTLPAFLPTRIRLVSLFCVNLVSFWSFSNSFWFKEPEERRSFGRTRRRLRDNVKYPFKWTGYDGVALTGFIWFRTGTCSGFLWAQVT